MLKSKYTQELYSAFIQTSSLKYSNSALSKVNQSNLSHDSIIRWLNNKSVRPERIMANS